MALADSGRAIGAVTRLLRDHLLRLGFEVSVGKPEAAADTNTAAKLNLFLYTVGFDAALRNHTLRDGEVPPLWLVLKYLVTAFDDREESDSAAAHELLGRGLAALHGLGYLRLHPLVELDVRLALENNPEPLKLSFDDAGVELVSSLMQGAEERVRLSAAFQVRPVMIVPERELRVLKRGQPVRLQVDALPGESFEGVVERDDCNRPDTTLEAVQKIRAALPGGVVTAGNGWANPGEGRSAVLTATLRF